MNPSYGGDDYVQTNYFLYISMKFNHNLPGVRAIPVQLEKRRVAGWPLPIASSETSMPTSNVIHLSARPHTALSANGEAALARLKLLSEQQKEILEIAALHGGSIEAHSDGPGLGSEFVLRLKRG